MIYFVVVCRECKERLGLSDHAVPEAECFECYTNKMLSRIVPPPEEVKHEMPTMPDESNPTDPRRY